MNAMKILEVAAVAFALVEARTQAISADGSTLTVAQSQAGGSLVTSAGTWAFGTASNVYGNAVLLNGGADGRFALPHAHADGSARL